MLNINAAEKMIKTERRWHKFAWLMMSGKEGLKAWDIR
jgi:hypothetical protein